MWDGNPSWGKHTHTQSDRDRHQIHMQGSSLGFRLGPTRGVEGSERTTEQTYTNVLSCGYHLLTFNKKYCALEKGLDLRKISLKI